MLWKWEKKQVTGYFLQPYLPMFPLSRNLCSNKRVFFVQLQICIATIQESWDFVDWWATSTTVYFYFSSASPGPYFQWIAFVQPFLCCSVREFWGVGMRSFGNVWAQKLASEVWVGTGEVLSRLIRCWDINGNILMQGTENVTFAWVRISISKDLGFTVEMPVNYESSWMGALSIMMSSGRI